MLPDLTPLNRLTLTQSAWFIGLVALALSALLVFALLRLGRHWRRWRRLERWQLRDGPCVVRGVVDHDSIEPAAQVVIHQVGRPRYDQEDPIHIWRETEREVVSRPFGLRLPDGRRVRVEGPVSLVFAPLETRDDDDLEEKKPTRACFASVWHGATVWVEGQATPLNDGTPDVAALRSSERHPLIVSVETPAVRERRHVSYWLATSLGLALALGFVGLSPAPRALARLALDGVAVTAEAYEVIPRPAPPDAAIRASTCGCAATASPRATA